MISDIVQRRRTHFQQNYLLWIVVRHFLPAHLTEELCRTIVDAVSAGRFTFESLFESRMCGGPSIVTSWIVQPRSISVPLGDYLQRFIRSLAWQSDDSVTPITHEVDPVDVKSMQSLEAALWISTLDFDRVNEPSRFNELASESLQRFVAAIISLKALEKSEASEEIEAILTIAMLGLSSPLDAILVKHLGDLCGDADRWDMAIALYDRAELMLSPPFEKSWKGLVGTMRTVTSQSRAAALRIIQGPGAASDFLKKMTIKSNFDTGLLTLLNSSFDDLVAYTLSNDKFDYLDNRPAMLVAPLLLKTHNLANALQSSITQDYDDAHRSFWAILRRQTALGSATDSRRTKAYYGRSLIEASRVDEGQRRTSGNFNVGVRLLIESGFPNIAKQTNWTSNIVEFNVNVECIMIIITQANRNKGSVLERTLVIISVFQKWLELLPPDAVDAAKQMLQFLAESAANFEWTFFGNRNVSLPSFEVLREVCEKRPEFSKLATKSIVKAIIGKLGNQDYNAISNALETAQVYIDALDDEALSAVITATLVTLGKFNAASGAWPVIRPALSLLSSALSRLLPGDSVGLHSRVASTLVRFSLENEFENPNLMYLLRRLDPALIEEKIDVARLSDVVVSIRNRAKAINSTAAVPNILALLEAPAIAQSAGISDAINSLIMILKSAVENRPSISFSVAYQPLLLLAERLKELANGLSISEVEMTTLIEPIMEPLLQLWRKAPENPLMFAGFSIPPRTVPNTTLIHNWTFASIGFARLLGHEEALAAAMEVAARHPLLENSMAVARAIRVSAGDPVQFDVVEISREKREAFYPALGQRIIVLSSLPQDLRKEIAGCLLEQCFRLGPRGLDAGVFAVALEMGIKIEPLSSNATAYRQRLDNDRELRLSLLPLFESLRPSMKG